MKIIDLNKKEREVKFVRKFVNKERDVINNEFIYKDYVEVEIIGNYRRWKQFYPLDLFKELNPEIKI